MFDQARVKLSAFAPGYRVTSRQHGYDTIGELSPRRPCLKARPSLRVRCSGGLAETIFYFTTKHTKLSEILN